MDKYERTVLNRKTWVKKKYLDPAPRKKYIKRTIPRLKYKNELLREYILKCRKYIYRKDIGEIGYSHVQSALNRYAKFHNIQITIINYSKWQIIK